MRLGVLVASITVLVIVIYVALVVGSPPAASGGPAPGPSPAPPPPGPALAGYIQALQTAVGNLGAATQTLIAAGNSAAAAVGATFNLYDRGEGVSASGPASLQAGASSALAAATGSLTTYAAEVADFDQTVQAWTTATPIATLLGETAAAGSLENDVLNPMAAIANAAGTLDTFVAAWQAAYEAASTGGACKTSHDCEPQGCQRGVCTAIEGPPMSAALATIAAVADAFAAQGASSSPYQNLAASVSGSYATLFYYVAGINPPRVALRAG